MNGAATPSSAAQAAKPAALGVWMAEMEASISSKSSEERVAALRSVTALFVTQSPVLSEDNVALFDDVMARLLDEVSQVAQEEVSTRLAALPNAPLHTIRSLARGPIDVARPVLTQSPRISDSDLVDIITRFDEDHRLAITHRSLLSTTVTDALVAEGGQEVLRSVARNAGAAFSENGMTSLVARSAGDEVLQIAIGRRSDVPEKHLDAILARASERVREGIVPHLSEAQRQAMGGMLARAAQTVAASYRKQAIDYTSARPDIDRLQREDGLNEDTVSAFARDGKLAHVVLALAALTRLPPAVMEGVALGEKTESILIVCRALAFRWSSTRSLVAMGRGNLGELELESLAAAYARMSHATAGRIVRFLAVQQAAAREGPPP
jgi:hypothetical protein